MPSKAMDLTGSASVSMRNGMLLEYYGLDAFRQEVVYQTDGEMGAMYPKSTGQIQEIMSFGTI